MTGGKENIPKREGGFLKVSWVSTVPILTIFRQREEERRGVETKME